MRVLLVDDEMDLASALAERLDMRGIDTDWATSAKQALEMARNQQYDIAVLDVKMPKVGGLELRDQLQERYPQMKFIFLTGYGSEMDFQKVVSRSNENCYMVKPIEIQDLIELMNTLVPEKGAQQ